MNSKASIVGLLALVASGVPAQAETSHYADEIDITAAVREAGVAEKPVLEQGELAAYTIDNAFGAGETKEDRILLKERQNRITWTIADSFRSGQPIIVTSYAIKRTTPNSGANDPHGYKRAPKQFRLEGSLTGTDGWVRLSEVTTTWDQSTVEQTFEIDPRYYNDYRHYRFVTLASDSEDSVGCSFQYIRLNGVVGSEELLTLSSVEVDHLDNGGAACMQIANFVPALDSRLELDVSLNKVTGAQCIFAAKDPADPTSHFRFFHTDNGWLFFYGDKSYQSSFKAYAGVRYKIVVDGPIVTVNGVEVCNAGETLTRSANGRLCICYNVNDYDLTANNVAALKLWSVKGWDGTGNPALDLKPMLYRDGTGMFYDSIGKRCYRSFRKSSRLPLAFLAESGEHEITARVRAAEAQTVTPVEGTGTETADGFGAENLFDGNDASTDGRAIFKGYSNTIQYDIADTYLPGSPIVVTRYALLPGIGQQGYDLMGSARAPLQFELQASADGQTWVTLHQQMEGIGEGNYRVGDYDANRFGFDGLNFSIPEDKRGDYRHYRFLTYKSSCPEAEAWKTSLQAIKFYGFEGGVEPRCEPVEYVQNGLKDGEETKEGGTRFLTGVQPAKADLTVELKGMFTRTDSVSCLFCCRGANSTNPWVLFLNQGKFLLVCGSSNYTSDFPVSANTPYMITVKGNEMFVDGTSIGSVSASTDFTPGSEMMLFSSHTGGGQWPDNQARFKLTSCRILDSTGGVIRDYIPAVRTSDNVGGLFDRVNAMFLAAVGLAPRYGESVDADFRQGGRSLALANEPAAEEELPVSLQFAFGENQILSAGLYAAFDNERHVGTSLDDWAKAVKLTDVTSGIKSFSVAKLRNAEHYKYVKFFLRDELGYGLSCTKTFTARNRGLYVIVH